MTKEEAIVILKNISWQMGSVEREQNIEAINMAIEALKAEPSTEGRYEKAIKTLQEMPKYINSNTIGKKIEVLNYTKEEYNDETRKA